MEIPFQSACQCEFCQLECGLKAGKTHDVWGQATFLFRLILMLIKSNFFHQVLFRHFQSRQICDHEQRDLRLGIATIDV